MSTIETTTIANLRAMTTAPSIGDYYFYITDLGQEAEWYYDDTDNASIDNTGTILVSSAGYRFKRIYNTGIDNLLARCRNNKK